MTVSRLQGLFRPWFEAVCWSSKEGMELESFSPPFWAIYDTSTGETKMKRAKPGRIGLLMLAMMSHWIPLAMAERHAICARCKGCYVLTEESAGFCRDHVGYCGNCKEKKNKLPYQGMWSEEQLFPGYPLDVAEHIILGGALVVGGITSYLAVLVVPVIPISDIITGNHDTIRVLESLDSIIYDGFSILTGGHLDHLPRHESNSFLDWYEHSREIGRKAGKSK